MKITKRKIFDYNSEEQRTILLEICNKLYISRNISLSQEGVIEQLEKIDCLFRDMGYTDEDDYSKDN